ncbi:type II toxin-antitoxin system HipA family toxin [Octadecabacter ascidiaceicola]|uniref:type II toxin-antitoxin system HipA family toxin n=1 Tax=Octadecabacter ascidiaceicola TaxID=1655543 RepID=UPI00117C353A|nr:type II toxin-antitoxin system HipA family toxin [Octadecabacter ascidiaceicola]
MDDGQISQNRMRLAMDVDGHYRINEVVPRHFLQAAKAAGFGVALAEEVLSGVASELEPALDKTLGVGVSPSWFVIIPPSGNKYKAATMITGPFGKVFIPKKRKYRATGNNKPRPTDTHNGSTFFIACKKLVPQHQLSK